MSIAQKALAGAAFFVLVGTQEVPFESVVDRLSGRVIAFTRAHFRDRQLAEDLSQEVFLTLFQKIQKGLLVQGLNQSL